MAVVPAWSNECLTKHGVYLTCMFAADRDAESLCWRLQYASETIVGMRPSAFQSRHRTLNLLAAWNTYTKGNTLINCRQLNADP